VRCACIDIGSNTTRLLVAERDGGGLREVLSCRAFTPLRGAGAVVAAADARAVARVVAEQARLARGRGSDDVRVVATAALRHARNRDEACAAIERASGLEVEVLSGEDEARLAFEGAIGTLRTLPVGAVAVVDVGGGSTELVCGTAAGGATWSASLGVGSRTLADRHLRGDPPAPGELDRARLDVLGAFEGVRAPHVVAAYAVGGATTSLRRVAGPVLDREGLARGVAALSVAPRAQTARRLALHVERARVLPAAMLLLEAARAALGVPLSVASGGLREGVVLERLARAGDAG
jgi:exopolyphosphatase/guanosine-5'-triphosphate,3'-diphosphate pyrophosphatase